MHCKTDIIHIIVHSGLHGHGTFTVSRRFLFVPGAFHCFYLLFARPFVLGYRSVFLHGAAFKEDW
jgi:hypothetical protein